MPSRRNGRDDGRLDGLHGSRHDHDSLLNYGTGKVRAVETLLVALPALPDAGSCPDTCVVGVRGSPSHVNGAGRA